MRCSIQPVLVGNMRRLNLLVYLVLVIFTCTGSSHAQRRQGQGPPPLPPSRRPVSASPLLPPVPSQEFIDKLTKAQLAFIRHHQAIQENDKTAYNPYACLPKYICIVEDADGSKRTAVVNGLHPILREDYQSQNKPYQPGNSASGDRNKGRSDLPRIDPGIAMKYGHRLERDEFLRDQEHADEFALREQQRFRMEIRHQPTPDSGEASTESQDESAESGENVSLSPQSHRPLPAQHNFNQGQGQGHVAATVPWNDRKNSSGGNGASLLNSLKYVIPLPSILPKKRYIPLEPSPSPSSHGILHRLGFRGKRDVRSHRQNIASPFVTKLGPGIKSSDQCRVLYNGCDLSYEQVMQIADEGQVLIEGEDPTPAAKKPSRPKLKPEDDEADAAAKENKLKVPPLTPAFLNLLHSNGLKYKPKKKFGGYKISEKKKPGLPSKYGDAQSNYNKESKGPNKRPINDDEESVEEDEREKVSVASLPILPMRFQWGKPQVYINGKPQTPDILGVDSRKPTQAPTPPTTTKPTPPPPIFVAKPVYHKVNRTVIQTEFVKINSTHALEIKGPKTKPYRPSKTPLADKNGNPSSFASVFTEIAGSSGGIHDYFDKIANAVWPTKARTQKEYPAPKSKKSKKFVEVEVGEDDTNDDNSEGDGDDDEPETDAEVQQDESGEESPQSEEEEDDIADVDDVSSKKKTKPTSKPLKSKYKVKNKKKQKETSENDDAEGDDEDVEIEEEEQDDLAPVEHNRPNGSEKDKLNEDEDAEDEDESVADDEPKGESSKGPISKDKARPNKKPVEEESDEFEDNSEERRKRIKAAAEVKLPHFLPESVKQAIREDIINGGNTKGKKPEKPGAPEPLNYGGNSNHGSHNYGQGHNAHSQPPRGGGFFSFLKRPVF